MKKILLFTLSLMIWGAVSAQVDSSKIYASWAKLAPTAEQVKMLAEWAEWQNEGRELTENISFSKFSSGFWIEIISIVVDTTDIFGEIRFAGFFDLAGNPVSLSLSSAYLQAKDSAFLYIREGSGGFESFGFFVPWYEKNHAKEFQKEYIQKLEFLVPHVQKIWAQGVAFTQTPTEKTVTAVFKSMENLKPTESDCQRLFQWTENQLEPKKFKNENTSVELCFDESGSVFWFVEIHFSPEEYLCVKFDSNWKIDQLIFFQEKEKTEIWLWSNNPYINGESVAWEKIPQEKIQKILILLEKAQVISQVWPRAFQIVKTD
jgi:hypothetical protein